MPCPVVLVALLSAMPVGDTVWAPPPRLPAIPRPSDVLSTEGDVLIEAVTPLHTHHAGSARSQVPAASRAASVPTVGRALKLVGCEPS